MRGRLVLLVLLWAEVGLGASKDYCLQNLIIGFEGKDIVLHPVVNGTPEEITWKKEENLVFEWIKGSDHSNGSLTLRNLSHSDDGNYTAEVRVGNEIEKKYFCLKILEYLEPPDLTCSVYNGSIQVNCTSPPQNYSQNLPVSYLLEARGKFHREQSIQLFQNKIDLHEQITCFIIIANVNASSSITLSKCIPDESETQTRTRIVLPIALIVLPAGVAIAFVLWKKGCIRKWKHQERPGPAQDIIQQEQQPCNEVRHLLGNSEQKSEGKEYGVGDIAEGVQLEETQPLNESRCVSQNLKEVIEAVSEDPEPSLKEEGLYFNVPKPDSGSAENLEEENEGASTTGKT